ncbi:MAG: OmpA family protein [Pseudobdellovibrionaceae bacterium]
MAKGIEKFSTLVMTATLVFALSACSSKKKAEDAPAPDASAGTEQTAPQIDTQPMNFDAAGSDSGKIDGLQSINFEYDKASLSSEAKKRIQGNANWMKANPNTRLQIEGHCDSRGSIEYNLSLGERRAQAVKSYMSSLGVAAGRLSIISYGKEKPLSAGDSESDHVKNRRANFVPLGQ